MGLDIQHIEKLTRYELSGTISPEEKEYLDKIVGTNADAKRVYEQLKREFPSERLTEVSRSMSETFLAENPAFASRKSYRLRVIVLMASAVAAAAIVTMLIIGPISKFQNEKEAPAVETIASNHKGVELKLATGQTFNLTRQTGTISSGDLVLNNNNKNLSVIDGSEVVKIATLNVPNGMDYQVQLSDGTQIRLNAGTSLQFPLSFADNRREITVMGEAYITVKSNPNRPFFVRFEQGLVQVLGTEFNINTYDKKESKVALVTGRLKVVSNSDSVLLKPGLEATLAGDDKLKVEKFDSYDVLSWIKGEQPFTDLTLAELGPLIERTYGVEVSVESSSTTHKFTGVINRKTPVENFLTGLKLTGFVKEYRFDKMGSLQVKN